MFIHDVLLGRKGEKGKRRKGEGQPWILYHGGQEGAPMGLTYISRNCEIYLGEDSPYRDDMGSLPLDCILTAEEYNALPEEQKKDYEVLVPKPKK